MNGRGCHHSQQMYVPDHGKGKTDAHMKEDEDEEREGEGEEQASGSPDAQDASTRDEAQDSEGDESEDDDEDDEDVEPALKYARLEGDVPKLFLKDSASALAISQKDKRIVRMLPLCRRSY